MQQNKYKVIIQALQAGEFLTSEIADKKYGVKHLPAQISNIKKRFNIKIKTTIVPNPNNLSARRAVYSLNDAASFNEMLRLAWPELFKTHDMSIGDVVKKETKHKCVVARFFKRIYNFLFK
jgi:hypothetical protein